MPTSASAPDLAPENGDRRRRPRIPLSLDVIAPVVLSGEGFRIRGVVRDISEEGVLVEVSEAPPMGTRVEVTFEAVAGSQQAGEALTIAGEVRHQIAWSFIKRGRSAALRGVGIRFLDTGPSSHVATSWIFRTGHSVH